MRILHFCMHAPFTENYSYQDNLLTEYQHKLGHTVRIVTTTKTRGTEGKYIYTEPGFKVMDNGVELVRIPAGGKLSGALGTYKGLIGQMRDFSPDMIFIHGLCSFVPGTAVKYKKRFAPDVHIVADNHQDSRTTPADDFVSSVCMRLHRIGWKRWISGIDRVYGTTSWRVDYAHERYGIPYEKLDVLVMGIDEDSLPSDRAGVRSEYRRRAAIPDDGFVFISGGKIDKEKGVLEAMSAFSRLKGDDLYYIVFGSVSDDIKEKFSESVKADGRIRYLSYLSSPDIKNYFISADFGLFPGRHSVLWEEAVGCGLPCLFHRYGEKDHTEVCGNCICIEGSDEESLYGHMERVVSDKELYARLKKNSEEAAKAFSYRAIAEKSLE